MGNIHKNKLNIGWVLILFLSIIPIILWFLAPKLNLPFNNIQNIITSLGELFGLTGMVLFSINLILATRLPFIEKLFNGLNNIYREHNIIGQLSLILLLFHPLFLLPRYISSFKDAINFLFISNLWARNFGIISLWIMILLIILTLYLKPKYNFWKVTHKFFGLALFLGGLHAYLIPGYIMNSILLKSYILGFATLGIFAFFYKSIFGKYFIKTYQYAVKNINYLDEKIIEISLSPKGKKINFHAGQFVFISFNQNGLSESHPFSISSSPNEELLKITIKALGDFTMKLINQLQKETIVKVEGPYGTFSYEATDNKNQIWIAGGIGITPFVSFAKDLINKNNQNINTTLFYCVKNEKDAICFNFFKDIENKINGFHIIPFYSQMNGYINAEQIKQNVNNFLDNDIFICAPPRMIQSLKKDLSDNNIPKSRIYSEEFNF